MVDSATIDNVIRILQKCRERKNLSLAWRSYAFLCENQLESHPVLGNYLVSLLIDCGSLQTAEYVFDRLSHRNRYSWSSLIAGHVDRGEPSRALRLYKQMQDESVQLKNFTYRALLKGCAALKDLGEGRELHAAIVKEGLDGDHFIGSVIVDMYGKCGLLLDASCVFDKLPVQDVVLWTTMISGYAEHGLVESVLDCLQKMLFSGFSPDASTFVCCLKACGIRRTVEIGHEVHGEIVMRGLEEELYVGHTLVDMYAKCGSLPEAQTLFDRLTVRSVIPWTALISGYAESGLGEEVLSLLERMQNDGVAPVAITFLCSLKVCESERVLGIGQKIHSMVTKMGFEVDQYIGTSLIDMYAKSRYFLDAWVVLSQLKDRGTATWNALIGGCADHGLLKEVLNTLNQMQQDGISPVSISFCCCLKGCAIRSDLENGRKVHCEVIKFGFENELDVHNTVIDMYVKCDSIVEAQLLFDQFSMQDEAAWTSLIVGYAEKGMYEDVMHRLNQMHLGLRNRDSVTYASSLRACGMVRAFEMGEKVHSDVVKLGLEGVETISSAVIDMYVKCGCFQNAWVVFDKFRARNADGWHALVVGYSDYGFSGEALNSFQRMQCDGFIPYTATYSSSLKACGNMENLQMGQKIHHEVVQKGLEIENDVGNALVDMYARCSAYAEAHKAFDQLPIKEEASWRTLITGYAEKGLADEVAYNLEQMTMGGISASTKTYLYSLKACNVRGVFSAGQRVHTDLVKSGLEKDIYIGTALVDMYAKYGALEESQKILENLELRGAIEWNALIAGYADYGLGEDALECFKKMKLEGVLPAAITYTCIAKSSGIVQALEIGQQIHSEVTKRALEEDPFLASATIDMYAKCGLHSEAKLVFDQLSVRDVAAWNAMIKANGENHEGDIAVDCFEEMQKQGVKPNGITFVCLLAACSHAGLVAKGWEFWELMKVHGIKPTLDHYTCMVDLLGRSGYVNEAEQFATDRNCHQSEGILRALLSACKIHGEVAVGERSFQQLLQLKKDDAASYLLMGDIYSSIGRFCDANNVEKMRRRAKARKMPGRALIEVKKEVHEFIVGDPISNDVLLMFDIIMSRLKNQGYVPNLDTVLRHDEDASHSFPVFVAA